MQPPSLYFEPDSLDPPLGSNGTGISPRYSSMQDQQEGILHDPTIRFEQQLANMENILFPELTPPLSSSEMIPGTIMLRY